MGTSESGKEEVRFVAKELGVITTNVLSTGGRRREKVKRKRVEIGR